MEGLIAQVAKPIGNKFEGIGNIGLEGGGNAVTGFASVISSVIGILTIVAAVYFLFSIINGAIAIMTSEGEKGAYESARKKITVGVIGMGVCLMAVFIMDLVAYLLGIDGILNFGQMINQISP